MPTRTTFTQRRLILCEGYEDASFIRALLKKQTGFPEFDISPNDDMPSTGGGGSTFGAAIMACEPLEGFSNVEDVVIVSDNDDDPAKSFSGICRQIEKARKDGDIARNWGSARAAGTQG